MPSNSSILTALQELGYDVGGGAISNAESLLRGAAASVPGGVGDLAGLVNKYSFGNRIPEKYMPRTTEEWLAALPERMSPARRESSGMEELGTVMAPGLGKAASAASEVTRTGRNLRRVVVGSSPREAAAEEFARNMSPNERALASSPRGWVGPVKVGEYYGVDVPRSSRLVKATDIVHTHPVEEGLLNPLSAGDRSELGMHVLHADPRANGALTQYYESLGSGKPPTLDRAMSQSEYIRNLRADPTYSSNVPENMYHQGLLVPEGRTFESLSPEELSNAYALRAMKPLKEGEKVDLGRRGLFGLGQAQADNLPAVVPQEAIKPAAGTLQQFINATDPSRASVGNGLSNLVGNLAQTPLSRRQVIQAAMSQAAQRFLPKSPLQALVQEAAPAAFNPAVSKLSPELKAAALNLGRASADWNWNSELMDRGYIARNLLAYDSNGLIGEGKLSLKEAMRQLKSEPEVYEKFKKTLHDLGNEERASRASYAPTKDEYIASLREFNDYPEHIIAREGRMWDQAKGKFKEGRLPSEDSPYPMYDPRYASGGEDFEAVLDVMPEFENMLKGLTTKEAKKVWSDYKKSTEGKTVLNALKDYRKNEHKYYASLAEERGGVKGDYNENLKAVGFRSPEKILREELGARYYPKSSEVFTPEQSVYNLTLKNNAFPSDVYLSKNKIEIPAADLLRAKAKMRDALHKSQYHPDYEHLYKTLGLEVPVYRPAGLKYEDIVKHIDKGSLSKVEKELPKNLPEDEGFADGGLVEPPLPAAEFSPLEMDYIIGNVTSGQHEPAYAEGGSVETAHIPFDEAKISSLVNALREELNA